MRRTRRKWTTSEDNLLRDAVNKAIQESRPLLWRELAKTVPGRTNKDCRRRWWNSLAGGTAKGPWTESEDERLVSAVREHGSRWSMVAAAVRTRNGDQCSSHWSQALNPEINYSDWTEDEDERLLRAVHTFGTNWITIASQHVPKRTTLALKNRYVALRSRRGVAGSRLGGSDHGRRSSQSKQTRQLSNDSLPGRRTGNNDPQAADMDKRGRGRREDGKSSRRSGYDPSEDHDDGDDDNEDEDEEDEDDDDEYDDDDDSDDIQYVGMVPPFVRENTGRANTVASSLGQPLPGGRASAGVTTLSTAPAPFLSPAGTQSPSPLADRTVTLFPSRFPLELGYGPVTNGNVSELGRIANIPGSVSLTANPPTTAPPAAAAAAPPVHPSSALHDLGAIEAAMDFTITPESQSATAPAGMDLGDLWGGELTKSSSTAPFQNILVADGGPAPLPSPASSRLEAAPHQQSAVGPGGDLLQISIEAVCTGEQLGHLMPRLIDVTKSMTVKVMNIAQPST